MEKQCEQCGKPFYRPGKAPKARFCGIKCKGIASRLPTKQCLSCGNTFQPTCGKLQQPTCSRECGAALRKTGTTKPCAVCGTDVYLTPFAQKNGYRCCSKACADAWQGRNKDSYSCKTCGIGFRWSPSRKTQARPTYCTPACRDADPARTEMLIGMNVAQAKMRPNNLERAAYALLDASGIAHERQHLIGGKFCVDAFVPTVGLVIQFDGDYWHGNPEKFPEPDARQRRRMKMDTSQDAYMAACGYRVLRVWECHIKKDPDQVAFQVLAVIASVLARDLEQNQAASVS